MPATLHDSLKRTPSAIRIPEIRKAARGRPSGLGVDKYIADPLCGFEATVQLYIDVLQGLRETARPSRLARIPKTLPIYIFNGSRDPVSDNVDQLLDAYRAAGLTQVMHKVYSDGRHESFNETNRDVVTRDLIAWLDGVIDRGGRIAKDT